jgi:hypothetical protein
LLQFAGSKSSLNSGSQKNKYESMFSGSMGGSLPTTPNKSRNAENSPRKAKSNENLKSQGASKGHIKFKPESYVYQKKKSNASSMQYEDETDDSDVDVERYKR